MWLGISEEWWMQIWSGVIGATVAAIVSVIVALLVVSKTNSHQSALATLARDLQRERDDRALEVQRSGLQQQLDDQRRESSRLRMMEVRADLASAAAHLAEVANEGLDAVAQASRLLERAITRWRIESDDEDLIAELANWPGFARSLASDYCGNLKKDPDAASTEASWDKLNHAVSLLSVVSVHLPRPNYVPPQNLYRILQKGREGTLQADRSHNEG